VNTGPAERVEIAFEAQVAPYVRARVWHPSQQVREDSGGRLSLTMDVCHDWALRSWILSWGPFARVVSPAPLAREIRSDLEAAGAHYA
jgi:proteasome accessory factor B